MAVTTHEEARGAGEEDSAGSSSAVPAPDPPSGARRERSVARSAARIALTYLAVALLWVVFSDRIVGALVASHSLLTRVQTFKGSAFVSGSALLIYVLLRRELRERERDQGRLRQAETKHRTLLEQVPAIVYTVAGDDINTAVYMSPYYERMLGYTPEERLADPELWLRMLHPEDRDRVLAASRRSRSTGEPFAEEYRLFAKDGRLVWVRDEAVLVSDDGGRPMFQQGVMLDITERKQAEAELRRSGEELRKSVEILRRTDEERRGLLLRLVGAEEEERRRIASDVHDGPIQKLTAVGLRLDMLRARLAGPEEQGALDELLHTVEDATTGLRQLVFELRPPALDRDGLAVALREYLDQVSLEGGFCYRMENLLDAEPPSEAGAIAYRIAREALGNVRKHARAKSVRVRLAPWNLGVKARIEDDGVGLDPAVAEEPSPGHLGMSDMRERAEMAGGWFRVKSVPGEGTTVEFWVPVSGEADGALVPSSPALMEGRSLV